MPWKRRVDGEIRELQSEVEQLETEDRRIERELHEVVAFTIQQHPKEKDMTQAPVTGIAPGDTQKFTATPVDRNGNASTLPAGVSVNFTSSDPTNAPIAQGDTPLDCFVTVAATATPGQSFTITATATMPDGTTPTGSVSVPYLTLEVASFVITQSAR